MNKINVCLSCDDNYAKYAGVVIASILCNANDNDALLFYILDGGIKKKNKDLILKLKSIKKCEINFVKVDDKMFADYAKVKTHDYISLPACYRLKLPTLLPKVKRVIYFDCDVVVNDSLAPLFNIDMGKYSVAGVRDLNKRMLRKNPSYVNSGVLVFDLDNMKKQKLEEKLFNYTKKHIKTIKMGDQEIINKVLKGKIKIIDDKWNVQSSNFVNRSSYMNHPVVIHFVSKRKPWHYASFSYHKPLYFKYLQMTPWALDKKEYKHWTRDNRIASWIAYVKHRPLFFLRPRFYKALFLTYIKPLFEGRK